MSPIVPLLLMSTLAGGHTPARQDTTLTVKEAKPGYLAQAKVDSKTAMHTALANVPGGKITQAEVEKAHGRLVYAFDIAAPGKPGTREVMVDAGTGKLLPAKHTWTAKQERTAKPRAS